MNSNLPAGAEMDPNAPWNQNSVGIDESLCRKCDAETMRKIAIKESVITKEDEYDIYERMYEKTPLCSNCKAFQRIMKEYEDGKTNL